MTTTDRGARLRAIQAAGAAAAALLAVPGAPAQAAAGNVAEGETIFPPSPRQTALRAPIAGHVTVAGQMQAARRSDEQRRLIRVADRLAGRVARAREERPARGERARLRGEAPAVLRDRIASLRGELRDARRERAMERGKTVSPARRDAPSATIPPQLEAIAACESGGDPNAIGGGGLYRGKYQFSFATWASVGGSGDPAAAPEAEQDMRAAMLYARAGATPWPVCGH
jgi:hypothetical protein